MAATYWTLEEGTGNWDLEEGTGSWELEESDGIVTVAQTDNARQRAFAVQLMRKRSRPAQTPRSRPGRRAR